MHGFHRTCDAQPADSEGYNQKDVLEYIVREPIHATNTAPVLILLHGYGSNEKDLFSLALQIPENWLVISARAPISQGNNRYKWYDVDEQNYLILEEEEISRNKLLQLIQVIKNKYKVDENKIVSAGFSQGATMALGLALTAPKKILAAGCFGGYFLTDIRPHITNTTALDSKQIFIAHGTKDHIIPFSDADENQKILEGWDMKITRSTDDVGHSISQKHLAEFATWLHALS